MLSGKHCWPAPGENATSAGTEAVSVVLIGWLGCKKPILKKYSAMYTRIGIKSVTIQMPAAEQRLFGQSELTRGMRLRPCAGELAAKHSINAVGAPGPPRARQPTRASDLRNDQGWRQGRVVLAACAAAKGWHHGRIVTRQESA